MKRATQWIVCSTILCASLFCSNRADAQQEAHWIWAAGFEKNAIPQTTVYFRKAFSVSSPEQGQITIAADDNYELFLNGRRIAVGNNSGKLDEHNITRFLSRGRNIVSIKVSNVSGNTAAVAARVMVKNRGGGWSSFSTDRTWKTSQNPLPLWNTGIYNDNRWPLAQSFGRLGDTAPWDREEHVAAEKRHKSSRFKISEEFEVERIVDGDDTGSLIAMTFNEFGHVIASREEGPLLLIYDSDDDGMLDTVREYCDQVTSCQGILALNGDVYVTGVGPAGAALYRLSDTDRDGRLEKVVSLIQFQGDAGEHGAHGLVLGPDGLIYIVVGNHTSPVDGYAASSPHRNFYEGDIVPRYEDPGGHAAGVKTPGGVILRTDTEGKNVELVAGGLRNAYDLAFNREGELFVHDSDMESDEGTPWYRPTRLYHVTAGAEFGWRSGWAKWPDYFVDSHSGILDTGRGSPTGSVVYNHYMFPTRYHNTLFLADWSEGRILAVSLKKDGASYQAHSEVFLEGKPLNVTDLEIGPDGWMYFITGGRGTSGGVYRVKWMGTPPSSVTDLGTGLNKIIRQPQMQTAWTRQEIATEMVNLGDNWARMMKGVARSTANPSFYRTRALDLMQLFGPPPTTDFLVEQSQAKNEEVRSKAADLMGVHSNEKTRVALTQLLNDPDRGVRRHACEALVRAGQTPEFSEITHLLTSDDNAEAWAARRLLETMPTEQWQDAVLKSENHRLFIQGALALMIAHPSQDNGLAVLQHCGELMGGFISDRNFIDMLRLMQVTILRGAITGEDVPELKVLLADEFPSGNGTMNRELIRLLAALKVDTITDRYVQYLKSSANDLDKLQVAMHLQFIHTGWTNDQKLDLLSFYEDAQLKEGGNSYPRYILNATRDFSKTLTEEQSRQVLAFAAEWPNAGLGAMYKLPHTLDTELFEQLKTLDERIAAFDDEENEAYKRLKVGIVAMLARSADEASMEYLREIWVRDPERRLSVTMGLAQRPDGLNWDLLVQSLPILEKGAATEVVGRLLSVDKKPDSGEPIRNLIILGQQLEGGGPARCLKLLEQWTGQSPAAGIDNPTQALVAWSEWFAATYPDMPPAVAPVEAEGDKWKFEYLVETLLGDEAIQGSAERGEHVFAKAQCAKCHRFGTKGESLGPDLTKLSSRFMKKEILRSIVFPSHIISDQYAAKNLVTVDGVVMTGIVALSGDEYLVLQTNGEKIRVAKEDVEEITPSKKSAMPDGLLNELTIDEIADLFALLSGSTAERVSALPGDTSTK